MDAPSRIKPIIAKNVFSLRLLFALSGLVASPAITHASSVTVSASTGFYNTAATSSQSGTFTATFDASPSLSPSNAVIALSKGTQTAYTGLACIARFNTSADIDAYNGTTYQAAAVIPFSANFTYHFRMVVNVPANTYSVYVTPPSSSELLVGLNYKFRTAVTSLDTWTIDVNATPGGSVTVSNLSVVTPQAATPAFSPVGGTYSSAQTVTITSTTSGASFAYTTDGSTPTESGGTVTHGVLYSSAVPMSVTTTLKALAFKTGMTDSTVFSGLYTINLPQAAAPTFSPVAGTYTSAQTVTITSATSGASIAYTTDGTTPTESGGTVTHGTALANGGTVSISVTCTLKALALKTGMTDSTVFSGLYTINLPQAAAPTFSPVAGTYTSAQTVTITSATSGASIAYTTDGTTPTESGGTVTHGTALSNGGTVSISVTCTLKAVAFKTGMTDSSVFSGLYTINLPVLAPTFSPAAGTYTSAQTVTITSATSGASIAYTTDGTTPTESGGTVTHGTALSNGGTVSISVTCTLKALALKTGMTDSTVFSGLYTINLPVLAPTFSPVAGTYTSAQTVTITSATSGASIAYTTDGTAPTESGGTVTHGTALANGGSVSIGVTCTLKAFAFKTGMTDSSVFSGLYTINLPVLAPTFSPAAGTFTSAQTVTITSATSGASIAYTTDGTTPTESGGTVTHGTALSNGGSVSISVTCTLKAVAFKIGFTDSAVTSGLYTINLPQAATPTFTPVAGTYTSAQTVTITSATSGASIAYTTDGTTPTESGGTVTHGGSLANGGSVSISASCTLKALAFKTGMTDSTVFSGLYTISTPIPVISSASTAFGTIGESFSYQITGSNSPTSYGATGLPAGLSVNPSTGLISGTPGAPGTSSVILRATNAGGTGSQPLALKIADDWVLVGAADFNGDGKSDLIWQNTVTGQRTIWLMNGTTLVSGVSLGVVSTDWDLVGAADLNGDGKPDLIWQNTVNGQRAIWLMNGTTYVSSVSLGTVSTDWDLVGAADFLKNGNSDLILQNNVNGQRAIWLMNGTTYVSSVSLGTVSTDWDLVGAADFNQNGNADLILQDSVTGQRVIWLMTGTTYVSTVSLGIVSTDWNLVGAADFNGDGYPDLIWQDTVAIGQCQFWLMNGTTYVSTVTFTISLPYLADFEASEGYILGSLNQQLGWIVSQGSALVTNQDHFSGLQSVVLQPSVPPAQITQGFAPFVPPSGTPNIIFVDFYAKPVAESDVTTATTFNVGGSRFAFVLSGAGQGTLEAFNGNGSGGGTWSPTNFTAPLTANHQSQNWIQLTARLDFTHSPGTWDLYANGAMVAANLGFLDNTSTALASFSVQGDAATASEIDYILAGPNNPLFADANNDGIDDAWEQKYGLSTAPGSNDRNILSPSGNGSTILQNYINGTDPNDYYSGVLPVLASLVDPSGVPGAQGLVSVKVTRASDGSVLVNAPVTLAVTTGASTISTTTTPGSLTSVNVRTNSSGIAQAYVNFVRSAFDVLVATTQSGNQAAKLSIPINPVFSPPLTGASLWLKADVGVTADASGHISSWLDQSGQVTGNNAIQTNISNQPTLVSNIVNGHPVVAFNGGSNYFTLPNFLSGSTQGEVFVVFKAGADPTSNRHPLWSWDGSSNTFLPDADGHVYDSFGSTNQWDLGIPSVNLNVSFHLYNSSSQTNEWVGRLDGNELFRSSANTPAFPVGAQMELGQGVNNGFWLGDISEIIVYNHVLTAVDRQAVGAYLGNKYNLSPSLIVPAAPANLGAIPMSANQISVEWLAPVSGSPVNYLVERSTDGVNFMQVANVATVSTYLDTGLTAGTTYTYRVRAQSYAAATSGYSNTAAATTLLSGTALPLANLRLWLKADTGATANGTGHISTWADQSGSNNATQATPNIQPTLVPAGPTGRLTVHFDGSQAQSLNLPNVMNGASAGEIFVVVRAGGSGNGTLWNLGTSSYPANYFDSTGQIHENFGSTQLYPLGVPTQPLTVFNVYNVSAAQTGQWSAWLNGLLLSQATGNTVAFNPTLWLGGSFTGDVAEMIVYGTALTPQQRDTVNAYLVNKYQLYKKPDAPTNLVATPLSPNQISLQWSAAARSDHVNYLVERSTGGGSFMPVASVADGLSYIDTGSTLNPMSPGQTYTYQVRAQGYAGLSDNYSNRATAILPSSGGTDMPLNGMRLWLKADAGLGPVGAIDTWPDQSGLGNDATQTFSGSARAPTLVTSATDPTVPNGRPVVRFNGSQAQALNLPNVMNGASAGEIFVVVRAGGSGGNTLWNWGTSSYPANYPDYSGQIHENFGSTQLYPLGVPAQPLTVFNVYNVSAAQTGQWSAWLNGLLLSQATGNTVAFNPTLWLGGSFTGDVAEMIVYGTALTPQQRDTVNAYLVNKYQLYKKPDAPTNLVATPLSPNQISLQWSAAARSDHVNYLVERSTGGGSFMPVASVADGLSYIDTGSTLNPMSPGQTYTYQVRAQGYAGLSDNYSNRATAILPSSGGTDMPLNGMRLWLKADAGLGPVGAIDTWPDQSGLGNDATQTFSGSARAPTLVTSATDPTVPNGRPVVRFNGSQAQALNLPNVMNGASAGEIFVVVRAGGSGGNTLWNWGTSSYPANYPDYSGQIHENFGSTQLYPLGVPAQPLTVFNVYNVSAAQTGQWSAWLNGLLLSQATGNTVAFNPTLWLGGSFTGDVAEMIVYGTALTPQQRVAVNTYLGSKYNYSLPITAAPVFSPGGGAYTSAQAVTMTSATSGASIRYTTDGSTPTGTNGATYSNPVIIGRTTTLNAFAFKNGFANSNVTSATYTVAQAAAPTFSPGSGTYASTQFVTMASSTSGASIRYTTDGSTPTETNGATYSGPVVIGRTTTLSAIAYGSGFTDSNITSATYAINLPQAAAPVISPGGGTYTSTQFAAMASATNGASIRFTTDGSTPTETVGTIYSSPVIVGNNTTVKAIAYEGGFTDSSITNATYSIGGVQVATPAFSPGGGTYTSAQTLAITSPTVGAAIRYTTDGSAPTETNGTLYAGLLTLSSTTTLKAIAYRAGFTDSNVANATYTINLPPVAAPTFSPGGGTYTSTQWVSITTATSGASIRYTRDGSTPTETNGVLYSGPVIIGSTTTLNAVAYKGGLGDSPVTAGTYTVNHALPGLPYATGFEPGEGYTVASLDQQLGWRVGQGAASITTQDASSGSQSVVLQSGTTPAQIAQAFAPVSGENIVFVDFYAKPVAEKDITTATTFDAGSARFAFVLAGSGQGTLMVFNGDGSGGGQWVAANFTAPLAANNQLQGWLRLTARFDFVHKTWDLYANGSMVAADIGFRDGTSAYLSTFSVTGDTATATELDTLSIGTANPLFADVNNDGIDDPWETASGLSLSTNDRYADPNGDGLTVLEDYLYHLNPSKPAAPDANGQVGLIVYTLLEK